MFASTNLVVELGVVLVVLMGWQFAAAEFVGGSIMIVLLALTAGFAVRGGLVERARKRLQEGGLGGHDHQAMVGVSEERQGELERTPWGEKLTSKAAWADAASYTMADVTMVRKELVIGYVVAGFFSVLVPTHIWNDVFLTGHGFWTSLENVVVGPFIAFISFVCSIGNVPMAAVLWGSGISFGGVLAFLYADLIVLPLLDVYRRHYGWRMAAYIFVVFYVTMVLAALIMDAAFTALGWVPQPDPNIRAEMVDFQIDYTFWLNIAFGALAAYFVYVNWKNPMHHHATGHGDGAHEGHHGHERSAHAASKPGGESQREHTEHRHHGDPQGH
jgi:uncharacterized membrane protein YraQ (UPF0718 family)